MRSKCFEWNLRPWGWFWTKQNHYIAIFKLFLEYSQKQRSINSLFGILLYLFRQNVVRFVLFLSKLSIDCFLCSITNERLILRLTFMTHQKFIKNLISCIPFRLFSCIIFHNLLWYLCPLFHLFSWRYSRLFDSFSYYSLLLSFLLDDTGFFR